MKLVKHVAILAAVTGISAVACAQTAVQQNQPLTRGEVKQDLRNVESEGYRPGDGDRTDYPQNAQAAERRLSKQQAQTQGYGGVANGTTASGMVPQPMSKRNNDGMKGVYFGR
ncbi:DUF4148 domain-containing protein [Paraburkholderia diazotrophica]|uniref:DUF4148 domain-containing protein n=1 Tax=Paraburkholderia diazotrophica TaxID=667676 RepID=A0A1H6Z234_9BURK|nr:DUF4148 domain-containing protein [Paraburkholderia diazotrophica]SEJ46064.1 protein of unknown function [Paraburkholderia diazotrophica]